MLNMATMNTWTDLRIEMLRRLWAEGKTAKEIAELIGDVSRNAVIGKAHRLGLQNRSHEEKTILAMRGRGWPTHHPDGSPIPRKRPLPPTSKDRGAMRLIKARLDREKQQVAILRAAEASFAPAPAARLVSIWELGPGMCRWPFGDRNFTYCGCPAIPARPYCAAHDRESGDGYRRDRRRVA